MSRFNVLCRKVDPFGSRLIEASAGTGKTFAIEHLVTRQLLDPNKSLCLEEIVVVTFTRAAARELKRRIHRTLQSVVAELRSKETTKDYVQAVLDAGQEQEATERLERALMGYDSAAVYTLHGFCFRLLKEFAFEAKRMPPSTDPDTESVDALIEAWVASRLKEASFLEEYPPFQLQKLLKKHGNNPLDLIRSLVALSQQPRAIHPQPSYQECLTHFNRAIASLAPQDKEMFCQQMSLLSGRYLKMRGVHLEEQLQWWGDILSVGSCSDKQFAALMSEPCFLEGMIESEQKKRVAPLEPHQMSYLQQVLALQKSALPWLEQARDPTRILLRLARQLQQQSATYLKEQQILSADHLLKAVDEALEDPSFCQLASRKYRSAIIDEFQDTDPVQWSIIKKLFLKNPQTSLHLVGDPKQSIYAFRSADVYVYLDAVKHLGEGAKQQLDTNFRSTPSLVAALNRLFGRADPRWMHLPLRDTSLAVPSVHAGSSTAPLDAEPPLHFVVAVQPPSRSRSFPSSSLFQEVIYPYIASEIIALHTQKGVPYHEIAILIKDRFQGQQVVEALERAGIRASLQRGSSLVDSEAYHSLKETLRAIDAPDEIRRVRLALASPLFGWSASELTHEESVLFAQHQFKQCRQRLHEEGYGAFHAALFSFCKQEGASPLAQELITRGQEALYFDLRKLCQWLLEQEQSGATDPLKKLIELAHSSEKEDPALQASVAEEKNSVALLTMHRSKGLEFKVVFALGLVSRHPPSEWMTIREEKQEIVVPFDPSVESCKRALQESDAEKQRLLYVALTRAKAKLYIPFVIEEKGFSLPEKGASPLELFMYHCLGPQPSVDALMQQLRAWAPDASCEQLAAAPLPSSKPLTQTHLHYTPATFAMARRPLHSFTSLVTEKPLHLAAPPVLPPVLPLGKESGILIHALFEAVFKRGLHHPLNPARVAALVETYTSGTTFVSCQELLTQMILSCLSLPLEGFSLSDVPSAQMHCEMEFLYSHEPGWIKGFMDLCFCFQGKYYLLDWKSNYLGPSPEDYTPQKMQEAIDQHQYDLQAKIYTESLRRYVKLFDNRPFTESFGGVFYVFVRGMQCYRLS